MYAGNVAFEHLVGWEAINQFTVNHIAEHPAPIPIPDTTPEYEIELFEDAALVFYAKEVDGHTVQEVRFMVKEADQWKIARMETIY
jgi:hypothetical protein